MEVLKIYSIVIVILILIAVGFYAMTLQIEGLSKVSIPFCIQTAEVTTTANKSNGAVPSVTTGITIETLASNEWMKDCCTLFNESADSFQLFGCNPDSPCYNTTCFVTSSHD